MKFGRMKPRCRLQGVAQTVTVEDVEVRKEDARLELMRLVRESVGREYSAENAEVGSRRITP
jgi:hypothetical protein